MRLAVFTSHFPGRVNTFFARDIRGLIDAGVDVEIFAIFPLDPALWVHVPDLLSERVLSRKKVHYSSVTGSLTRAIGDAQAWRQAPELAAITASALRHGPAPTLKSAYVMPKALAWAAQHGDRFDHVLAYWGNYSATCAYLFHRAAGRQVPFTTFLHAGTDLYRTRVYLPQKLRYADNIVVVCDFNRRFLQQAYPADYEQFAPKIYLHHLGLDVASLQFHTGPRVPNRVVAAGGLHKTKGFDDLLRAAAELRRAGREIETVIVGGGPEESALKALAERLGVATTTRFLGWTEPEGVLDQIRQAALLVHPSVGLGDAVPTVIKEAMALGTPVIASDVAGIPELIDEGRCGVLTPPAAPSAIAQAIARLLDREDERAHFARAGRERACQLFSLARNSAALAERLRRTPTRRVAARPTEALA